MVEAKKHLCDIVPYPIDKEIEWNYSATPGTALIPPRENTPEKWVNSETGGRYDGMTPPFREEMYVFEYDDSEEGE